METQSLSEYMKNVAIKVDASAREILSESSIRQFASVSEHISFNNDELNKSLRDPFLWLYESGGKRIRPVLACLAFHAFGGKGDDIYRYALIPELIHSGTLIVDDIEDRSESRRGRDCVYRKFGEPLSINAGNYLYFAPLAFLLDSGMSNSRKAKIYESYLRCMGRISVGQALDIFWSERKAYDVGLDNYLEMSSLKTGALLKFCVELGALAAGAELGAFKEILPAISDAGVAFQIKDDLLNLTASSSLGKKDFEDIKEGKLTFLVAAAMAKYSEHEKSVLSEMLAMKDKSEKDISEILRLLEDSGAMRLAKEQSEMLLSSSLKSLKSSVPGSDYKNLLLELVQLFLFRKI
jgi:geranylgeranyl pyrophosphate synthase